MKYFASPVKKSVFFLASFLMASSVQAAVLDTGFATDGGFSYGFDYGATIPFVKVLDDGKVLVGGSFDQYQGIVVPAGLARLNADLTLDTSFDLDGEGFIDGSVTGVEILDDGKMLITGSFEGFNGDSAYGILRLNADLTLDESFDPATGGSNTGGVQNAIALDDGDYLIGFTSNGATYRGVQARGLLRINNDGSVDNGFGIDGRFEYPNVTVEKMVRQTDGKIVVSGYFLDKGLDGEEGGGDDETYTFVRLNADGSFDNTFDNEGGADGSVYVIKLLSDGSMYVAGQFTEFSGHTTYNVARVNDDGTVDTSFTVGESFGGQTAYDIVILDDGKILIGGNFSQYGDLNAYSLIRFNSDGSLDDTFKSHIGGGSSGSTIYSMGLLDDGRLLAGGYFASDYSIDDREYDIGGLVAYFIDPRVALGTETLSIREGDETEESDGRHYLVVSLNTKPSAPVTITLSSVDDELSFSTSTFTFYPADWDISSPWEGDNPYYGTIVSAVDDETIEGNHSDEIAFSVSSSDDDYDDSDVSNVLVSIADNDSALLLDQTFRPSGIDGDTRVVAIQSDGKSIVGGDFTGGIRRLNLDGSEDDSFDIGDGFNAEVMDLKILSSGDIVAVGLFTQYDGEDVGHIARLNADGSLDTAFDTGTGFDADVRQVVVGPSGKIVVMGDFSYFDGDSVVQAARLNSDGSLDDDFSSGAGFDGQVTSVQVQSDGKVLLAGDFGSYDGSPIPEGLVRLNADGSLDEDFSENLGTGFDTAVRFMTLQSDGKIIASGNFQSFDGNPKAFLLRLNSDGTLDGTFESPEYVSEEDKHGLNGPVFAIAFIEGGKMLVGGDFSIYTVSQGNDIASAVFLLNADGTRDSSFGQIGKYSEVRSIAVGLDGQVIVGDSRQSRSVRGFLSDGSEDDAFSIWPGLGSGDPAINQVAALSNGKYLVLGSFNGVFASTLLRVDVDGSIDESFVIDPSITSGISGFYVDPDGKIVVYAEGLLARLDSDGSIDESFDASDLGSLYFTSVVPYGDGRLMVSTDDSGSPLVRVNADGSLDESFGLDDAMESGTVHFVESDGDMIVGGEAVPNNEATELVRLNSDGSLEEIISERFGFYRFSVYHAWSQADGKILVTGFFRRTSNSTIYNITRLNADGSLDRGFGLNSTDSQIDAVNVRPDGGIIVAGGFSTYSKTGESSVSARRIMKLLPSGEIDLSFPTDEDTGSFEGDVASIDVDADNKIIVAGDMRTFRGTRVQNIVRLVDTSLLENEGDVDTDNPVISNISVTANGGGEARISWATDEVTSGRVRYGLTSSYTMDSGTFDTNPRTVSHAINIGNLQACTHYHYMVISEDASNNEAVSSDGRFKTLGCSNSSPKSGRRTSVLVSSPSAPSIPINTTGLSIQEIIAFISQFIGPSSNAGAGSSTPAVSESSARRTLDSQSIKSIATRLGQTRRNLTVGSLGQEVRDLQKFLIAQGKGTSTDALAQVGDTGYFGSITRGALAEYQASHMIAPAVGYFGPITKGKILTAGQ